MTSPTSSRRQRSNRGGGSGGAMRKHAERELARRAMALLLVVAGAAAALFLLTGDAAASTAPAATDAPGSCANGVVVPQPAANPELVADCRVLLDLQPTLAGTATLNWGANTALSSWDGITVASLDGIQRVTELDMDGQGLNGTIPAQLGQLSGLRELRLAWGNRLTGSIPPELGRLTRLTFLNLAANHLSGPIPPELGSIGPQLTHLVLSAPQPLPDGVGLTGSIPAQLGNLSGLTSLYLDGNRLTGSIPPRLGRLLNLSWLHLTRNQLTGALPTQLGELSNLTNLRLEDNRLSGPIPSQLSRLTNLRKVYLTRNAGFSGCVPPRLREVRFNDIATLNLPDCASDASETPETPLSAYTLTVNAENGGTVDPPGVSTHTEATPVTLTASWNDATHTFVGWSGACSGAETTCTLELYADANVTAAFIPLPADRCASPTDADCIRAVYLGAPGDFGQVQDIPVELLLAPDADGRYRVRQGEQVTVVTAAQLPEDFDRFVLNPRPSGPPDPVPSLRLVPPVGTTYTLTLSTDEQAAQLVRLDLHAARTRPGSSKPIPGAVVVTTVFRVASCASGTAVANPSLNPELVADCERLIGLRDVLAGSGSLNWDVRTEMSGWTGVTLGASPQRVTTLSLASSGLSGQLSGLLGDLDGLTELHFNSNTLTGQIPSKLALLANLTQLYLANNSFSGCIPAELSSITNNDLSQLSLTDCAAPSDISYGKHTLTAGTYEYALVDDGPAVMFDVPDGLNLEIVGIVLTDSDDGGQTVGLILRNIAEQSWICVDLEHAEECYRRIVSTSTDPDGVAALLDRLSESIWMDESP